MKKIIPSIILITLFSTAFLYAGEADVLKVRVKKTAKNTYKFYVTVKHADTGWKHYADRWEVLTADKKKILATRVLWHPHVKEQPFTRSKSNVKIPSHIKKVIIRAHDKVHGYGGKEIKVKLPE